MQEQNRWADALVISQLFLDKESQKEVIGNYVMKYFDASNSMYALLMLQTDQAHLIFGSDQETQLLDSWKVQTAFILKHADMIKDRSFSLRKFFWDLAKALLTKRNDIYAFIFLTSINNTLDCAELVAAYKKQERLSLAQNFLITLIATLLPQFKDQKSVKVELAYLRCVQYNNLTDKDSLTQAEFKKIIQHRDCLEDRYLSSDYF